jgi:DegV family protein with EDD domain
VQRPERERLGTAVDAKDEGVRRVGVATDSTADLPPALASELGIAVVPCLIFWGQEELLDGVDVEPQAFYDRLLRSPELPRTSQPAMRSFVETYGRLLDEQGCEAVVSIHVAGNVSGTVNAAWAAAQSLSDPSRIDVIDSGQVSMGMGWAVVRAARMAQAGATPKQLGEAVRDLLPRLRAAAVIDSLENLYKGGRISQITAAVGTVLQIKPLISIRAGQIHITDRVRTRSRALQRLEAMVRDWGPLAEVSVLHTGAQELAEDLAGKLADLAPHGQLMVQPAGPALTVHLGLGAVGVCALAEGET